MRKTLGVAGITLAMFVACGSDESNSQPVADAGTGSDGGVRPDDRADADVQPDGGATPDGGGPAPRGFQIQSKDVVIQPSQEITYCYHFTTPNTETLAVNKWKSVMTPGVRFMALFLGGSGQGPGTLTAACPDISNASASNVPMWAYASYKAESELAFPSDDGTGKPLGFELPPGKEAYLMMHHVNATEQPITAHVTLNAEALPEGAAFTKTSTFVTYNSSIAIPSPSTNHVESKTCDTLPDTKFWSMGMHAHKQAVRMTVRNGTSASGNIAYESSEWANPAQKTWPANPFYTFDQGKLTYECVYANQTGRTIKAGNSFTVEETCMATGYYFPATKPVLCYCLDSGCLNF
ncbi:MAG: hypothetical protein J0I07_30840 [Myxococcales bacterium]|nr:hypothetical protein [Myxococcales bacterium]